MTGTIPPTVQQYNERLIGNGVVGFLNPLDNWEINVLFLIFVARIVYNLINSIYSMMNKEAAQKGKRIVSSPSSSSSSSSLQIVPSNFSQLTAAEQIEQLRMPLGSKKKDIKK
jgi:hypothetical protein